MAKTKLIGLRIETEQLKRIEELAKYQGTDKMEFIRMAIGSFLQEVEETQEDMAIQNYVKARMNEEELINFLDIKKIPEDLKEARRQYISELIKKK
jgi:predicted DNA-binding protein